MENLRQNTGDQTLRTGQAANAHNAQIKDDKGIARRNNSCSIYLTHNNNWIILPPSRGVGQRRML